jgi:hypothetical protein
VVTIWIPRDGSQRYCRKTSLRAQLPAEPGELVLQAIERAMEAERGPADREDAVRDGSAEKSAASFHTELAL